MTAMLILGALIFGLNEKFASKATQDNTVQSMDAFKQAFSDFVRHSDSVNMAQNYDIKEARQLIMYLTKDGTIQVSHADTSKPATHTEGKAVSTSSSVVQSSQHPKGTKLSLRSSGVSSAFVLPDVLKIDSRGQTVK